MHVNQYDVWYLNLHSVSSVVLYATTKRIVRKSFTLFQTLFKAVLATIENGGKPVQVNASTTLGYTKEQAEAIHRLKTAKDNYERLGLTAGASR